MQTKRLFFFLLSIALGVGLGLLYGWVIDPPTAHDMHASELRSDYRTDYVLMVAEIYGDDLDLAAASARLSLAGDPQQLAQEAILAAQQTGYAFTDVETLASLLQGFQNAAARPGGGMP